ncbi:hypothetical protein ACIQVR_42165 [Streptomyces xanthochromogenes]|uniref:hypothetical protein n=1 Tax=Streptomyces xanthochromogenes TaxID=67384 RepID=UPI0037FE835C
MTRYHYVITVEIPGLGVSTGNDSVTLNPGATRSQVYNHALSRAVANMIQASGLDVDVEKIAPITRFWSLDPEALETL